MPYSIATGKKAVVPGKTNADGEVKVLLLGTRAGTAVLRTRLYDAERQKQEAARAAERRGQVGTGDRSERIRTYNFPQGRVSDHRINLTLHKLPQILEGEALSEIVDALVAEHQAAQLAAEEIN